MMTMMMMLMLMLMMLMMLMLLMPILMPMLVVVVVGVVTIQTPLLYLSVSIRMIILLPNAPIRLRRMPKHRLCSVP